jgi:hypothetical protein
MEKKQVLHILSVCVCPVIQLLHCYLCPVWPCHTSWHPRNDTIFGKALLNTKCVFWLSLQLLSETFPILRITERDIAISVHGSSSFLSDFYETWILMIYLRKKAKYKIPWKFVRWDPTDRQIWKLIVAFTQFCQRSKETLPFCSHTVFMRLYSVHSILCTPIRHLRIDSFNGDGLCSLWGWDWIYVELYVEAWGLRGLVLFINSQMGLLRGQLTVFRLGVNVTYSLLIKCVGWWLGVLVTLRRMVTARMSVSYLNRFIK